MNINLPVITDSGGFQAMSLVRNSKNGGYFNENGVVFKNFRNGQFLELTPETCIETQIKIKSDIIMCLDDCTDPSEPFEEQEKSVERTIRWAKRCKDTFDKYVNETTFTDDERRPLIFGIIQGGNHPVLRKECAEALIKMDFDGYAYGGWPMYKGTLMEEILSIVADSMPKDKPKYAMGVGKPEDIQKCIKMGYNMFDCVLPTRDARHERLYVFNGNDISAEPDKFYDFLNIGSGKYKHDTTAISENCGCLTCQKYLRAYLHHLFKVGDPAAYRLATIHNLYFYTQLMSYFSSAS
ncbi:hypothetical protein A2619_00385 [candidate division WWE3 bacterium RIFOXYD1_FULL_39_9]|nr:MAG: hypothetical protein A2619_00385 [candidate division WWE3 bacterium RIFOXYD1_FULL_39_9]